MCFALIPKTTWDGDFHECTTLFMPQRLDTFDLKLDGQSISSYPLKRQSEMRHNFYQKFLSETNMISNPFSSGPISYDDFIKYNFIIPENLSRKKITRGDLCATIKFTEALSQKLQLVVFTIDTKCIIFDEYLNMEVVDTELNAENELDDI